MTTKNATLPKVIATLLILLLGLGVGYYVTFFASESDQPTSPKPPTATDSALEENQTADKPKKPSTGLPTLEENPKRSIAQFREAPPWARILAFSVCIALCTIYLSTHLKWDIGLNNSRKNTSPSSGEWYMYGDIISRNEAIQQRFNQVSAIAVLLVCLQGITFVTRTPPWLSWQETFVAGLSAELFVELWYFIQRKS